MATAMSSAKENSKKRKLAELEDSSKDGQLIVKVSDDTSAPVGPVLASFPALQPPGLTPFSVHTYQSTDENGKGLNFARRGIAVSGETDRVEFYSTDESEDIKNSAQYFVGIRNKRTNTVTLRPAPVQIFARRVKALAHPSSPSKASIEEDYQAKRATLGEAFGTNKALKNIRARERNQVDVSAMEGVAGHIQASIEANSSGLPTTEEKADLDLTSRQATLPPFNIDATSPDKIYPLHDMIPQPEFSAIPIKGLRFAEDEAARLKFIHFAGSEWIRSHLRAAFANASVDLDEGKKVNKKQLRLISYIACLMAFRAGSKFGKLSSKEKLQERLKGMPTVVIDGILSRFTETARDSETAKFTSDCAARLNSHIFALCLHADNYACDTAMIAADLKESVQTVNNQFKALGCKIENLSASECNKLGLPTPRENEKIRRAVLRAPLKFPTARMGKRR